MGNYPAGEEIWMVPGISGVVSGRRGFQVFTKDHTDRIMKAILLSLFVFAFLQLPAQSIDELFQGVKRDMELQDLDAAFKKLEEIDSIRPHHPVVTRQLLEIERKLHCGSATTGTQA